MSPSSICVPRGATPRSAISSRASPSAACSGDTARWTVGDTTSGAGDARRVHIMIKPLAPGLATNLIITTDRRVYHLALASTARTAMAAVSWTYPHDSLLAIERAASATRAAVEARSTIDPVRLDFGYAIRGDKPAWRPLRAFDDGRQTFIEFPPSLAQGEAPPLFVSGEGGEPELVNYRVSGRFYIVDRLFARAELRHGAKRQIVVRIVRTGDTR
ncbi:P-type conjugative transfer protein TrbG [Sphingopyxis granuli]|nr:P-type conjugative transfer protein TrbG [Sphingopyxis granuli]